MIDLSTGTILFELRGHTDYVRSGFEIAGDRLVTWSNDQTVRIWSLADGRSIHVLAGHEAYISWVACVGDTQLLSAADDGTLRLWSSTTGDLERVLKLPAGMNSADSGRATPSRACVAGDGHVALFDLTNGSLLRSKKFNDYYCSIDLLDADHFLVCDSETALVLKGKNGIPVATTKMPGYMCGHWVIDRSEVLIWRFDHRASKTLSLSIWQPLQNSRPKLIRRLKTDPIPGPTLFGQKPLALLQKEDCLLVSCDDYRLLEIDRNNLSVRSTSGVYARDRGGFRRYEPSLLKPATEGTTSLDVSLLGFESGQTKRWRVDDNDKIDLYSSPCWWTRDKIVFPFEKTVIEWDLVRDTQRKSCADEYWACHPEAAEMQSRKLRLQGNLGALVDWAQHSHPEFSSKKLSWISATISQLAESGTHIQHATLNGGILAWSYETGDLRWLDVENNRWIDCGAHGDLIGGHPLISPGGQVYLRRDQRFAALIIDGSPVKLQPEVRHKLRSAHWCSDDRIAVRTSSGVEVFDAATSESVAMLYDGHGLQNWSLAELNNGTLVTWSRSNLRSWRKTDLAPLVELRDPEDWGPGYAIVQPTKNRGLVFTPGRYTIDARIVHWDGEERINVYNGHRNDVIGITEGPDGRFLSWEHKEHRDLLVWELDC